MDGSICDSLSMDNVHWALWRQDQYKLDYLHFEFTALRVYKPAE
ncbi:MAG TPA: hypothetical protein PKD32_07285 [Saprospiraceae bacterium]|nr:hypothetical protein [Saprospiraceae bacterium]